MLIAVNDIDGDALNVVILMRIMLIDDTDNDDEGECDNLKPGVTVLVAGLTNLQKCHYIQFL